MDLPHVKEDFIQFVWKFGLFDASQLRLEDHRQVHIMNPGTQNLAGGPDFFNAKIRIGDTLWAGNVEIHIGIKHWFQHKHFYDSAYNNLILHVVYEKEIKPINLQNGREVPTISIGNLIYKQTLRNYRVLIAKGKHFIPCQSFIQNLDDFHFHHFYDALLVERLERKSKEVEQELKFANGDLDYAFLITLFKYFGAPLNKESFGLLARSFDLKRLVQIKGSGLNIEAFLFGMADMIHNQDKRALQLEGEFSFICRKYKLQVHCKKVQWQYSGVSPKGFPSFRVAQLVTLLTKETHFFTRIIALEELKELKSLFSISLVDYWMQHYNFGVKSSINNKNFSVSFINKLIINVVTPFLYFYGNYVNEEKYIARAIGFLEATKKENNRILREFENLKIPNNTAVQSQALLELYDSYCLKKKCMDCRLAYTVLKKDKC